MAGYTGDGDFRSNLEDRMNSAIDRAIQKAKSKINSKKKVTIQGEVQIDDKEVKEVQKEVDKLQESAKKPIKPKVEVDQGSIEKQIEQSMKKMSKKVKIQPTLDDVYNTDAMQSNITKLNKKLYDIYSKIYDPKTDMELPGDRTLNKKDMESFSVNYQTLKMLMDYFHRDVPEQYKDFNDVLYSFAKNKDDYKYYVDRVFAHGETAEGFYKKGRVKKGESVPEIKVGEGVSKDVEYDFYKQAKQLFEYMTQEQTAVQTQAKKIARSRQRTDTVSYTTKSGVTHSTTKTEGQTIETGNSGQASGNTAEQMREIGTAAKQAKKDVDDLSDSVGDVGGKGKSDEVKSKTQRILSQLSDIQKEANKVMQETSEFLADGFNIYENQEYFDDQKQKIDNLKKKAKELREALKQIDTDTPDGKMVNALSSNNQYKNRINGVRGVLDSIDRLFPSVDKIYGDSYQAMLSETERKQKETEQKIKTRNEEFIQKITSNEDFKKYGRKDWLEEYKEQLEEESADLDQIYEQIMSKLSERKEMLQKNERKNQRKDELRQFLKDNYQGKKSGKEYNDYIAKYKANFDALEDDGSNVADEIAKIQAEWLKVNNSNSENGLASQLEKAQQQAQETYEAVEKIMHISWNYGKSKMNIDLDQFLPSTQGDFKKLIETINLGEPDAADNNFKLLNDYIEDRKKQLTRWLHKTDKDSGWDNIHNPFDAEVFKNYKETTPKQAQGMLKNFQGYSKTLFDQYTKHNRIDPELKGFQAELFEQVKSGAIDAMSAIDQLRAKMDELWKQRINNAKNQDNWADNTSLDPDEKLQKVKELVKAVQQYKQVEAEFNEAENAAQYSDDEDESGKYEDKAQRLGLKLDELEGKITEFKDEYQSLKIVLKDGSEIIADATNFDKILKGVDTKQIKEAYLQYNELYKSIDDFNNQLDHIDKLYTAKDHDGMLNLLESGKTKDELKQMYKLSEQEAQDLFDKIQYVNNNLFTKDGELDLSSDAVDVYNEIADIIQNKYKEMASSVIESFNRMSDVMNKEGKNIQDYFEFDPEQEVDYYKKHSEVKPFHIEQKVSGSTQDVSTISSQLNNVADTEEKVGQVAEQMGNGISSGTQQAITSTEELISAVKELEEIYGKIQPAKYSKQYGGQYIDQVNDSVEGIDLSEYNSSDATEENIENTRTKMMEIYNLYKKITSAIKNNNGYYKGIQYTSKDQENLIDNFKAYAQNYHELVTQYNDEEKRFSFDSGLDPQYLETLDVVVQKLTRDFKGYAQEVIADSQSAWDNDKLYEEEQQQLEKSNAVLKERYKLLRDNVINYAINNGIDKDQRYHMQDLIPYIPDDYDLCKWGEDSFGNTISSNVLQDILKIFGIEIPNAAQKAKESITDFGSSFDLRAAAAPEELKSIVGDLEAAITTQDLPFEQAIERLNEKAKELGLTFDETTKKWVKLSSSTTDGLSGNNEKSQEQLQTEIETRKQRIAELQKQLDDYGDAMRDFDRKSKGNGDEYHRLQEEYLTQHGINPTYIQQEIEQLNKEIREYENKLQDIYKSPNQSPISSGNAQQDTGSVPQEEHNIQQGAEEAVQAVDNLGRKIDETFAKKISGTALVNELGQIVTLFHATDADFEKFDLSKGKDKTYGSGAYFGFSSNGLEQYGNNITEWFANVKNIFHANIALSEKDLRALWENYQSEITEIFGYNSFSLEEFIDESDKILNGELLRKNNGAIGMADFLGEINAIRTGKRDSTPILEQLGYDALDNGSGYINIFNPDNIIKATMALKEFVDAKKNVGLQESDETPISSATTTLPEQEQAAGQAGQQMGEQISEGLNKATMSAKELSLALQEVFKLGNNSASVDNISNPEETVEQYLYRFAGHRGVLGDSYGEQYGLPGLSITSNPEMTMLSNEALGTTVRLLKNKTEEFAQVLIDYYNGAISELEAKNQIVQLIEQKNKFKADTQKLPNETPVSSDINLNNIDSQITEIETKTKKMVEDISLMFAQPISADQNEEYYTTLLSQIENIIPAAKELKDQLGELTIPETATNLTSRANVLEQQFKFIDQMVEQQKDRIHSVYDSIDFEAQKAQKEAEEQMSRRQADIIQRINSNSDFKKYGDETWLADYIEKVRTDMRSVDEIYAEFESKLNERKLNIIAQEEKDEKQKGNREKFISYLKGISPSGQEEYGQNLARFIDELNSITDDVKTLEDAIDSVKQKIKESTDENDDIKSKKDNIHDLIEEYNKLKDVIETVNSKQNPTPNEKGQRTKARNKIAIVEQQLKEAGMYKKFDGEKVEWIEDKFDLKKQYQDMLSIINTGDFDKIKDTLQDTFNVDIDSMEDVEKLKINIEELIAVLDKANIDSSKLKLSDMDQFLLNDLMNPQLIASTLSSYFNVSENLVDEFRNKFKQESQANNPDPSGTREQTEAEREQADAAREAAEAEKERKKATDDANTPPPSGNGPKTPPPGGGNNPPGGNGPKTPPPPCGSGGGGNNPPGGNPPPKKPPRNYKNIIGTTYKDDGSWEHRYSDKNGRIVAVGQRYNQKTDSYESYEKEVTNYIKLQQDAIRVNNELIDAETALAAAQRQGYGNTEFASKLSDRITKLKEEKEALEKLADLYEQGPEYNGSTPEYTRAQFDKQVEKEVSKHRSKVEVKSAKQLIKDEEQKQRAIDRTNSFIIDQEGKIDRLQQKYIDKNPIKLPQKDLDKLKELRYGVGGDENNVTGGIQGWLNQNKKNGGRATTQSERETLTQMIKDYEQTAKLSTESQKIATKLAARSPEEARAALSKDLNSLLRDIQQSKADTTLVKQQLEDIIRDFKVEEQKYLNGEDSQINDKSFLKGLHARMNVAKSNFQDVEDEYKTNHKQLDEYRQTIKEAYDARSNLIKMNADMISGKPVEGYADALVDLREKAQAAGEAIFKIFEMAKSGKIDFSEAFESRDMYNMSKYGSSNSHTYLRKAINNKNASETKTLLTDYENARSTYQDLYLKQLMGEKLNVDETNALKSALETIKNTEASWNEEKAEGLKLTQKQHDAVEHLKEAQSYEGYSKNELEVNAMQDKLSDSYNKLFKKISKMREQSDWRADSKKWESEVKSLEDDLGNININVSNEDEFKKALQMIDEIAKRRQDLAKSSDLQPIGKDWQAKQHADLSKWMNQNKIAAKAFKDELKELDEEIDTVGSKGAAEEWNAKLYNIQKKAADDGLLGKSLGDRFKDQFKNTMTSLATYYLSFQDFIRYGRQAISIITELDTQLTEMRKVSNESLQTLQDYQIETFDIASRVGTTAAQIQSSTADWMRLGEDLQDAKKSAEYSTLLLNVSEFSSIDSATESLVAMSQAYQDIDKLDIIDKLNNIGNNFSISTSDLASSLQLSAGTLKVAGNSLDEAIALTVAGNQVLQDPQKVGQSLRTISLRLTGTSVEDMQEAGEEIDGLITTQSKLRKTIMDITKVSSNGYKGFDILTESGNYKSTYEMLKGIAEVWHEIGEEDRKMGTNRQSLLLETIAGKTRAAAASSILDNFETLQDVLESSLNSEGSAQAELDKYLDSIQGKAAQFQNELQKLASSAIDSSWIKGFIDLGTQLLKVITDLSDAFGGLNLLIGSGLGAFLQFKGKGKVVVKNALYTSHNNNAIMLIVQSEWKPNKICRISGKIIINNPDPSLFYQRMNTGERLTRHGEYRRNCIIIIYSPITK